MTTLLIGLALADPYLLSIGPKGTVEVRQGLTETRSGSTAVLSDVAAAAKGCRYVFVGESHDVPAHHQFQADVIEVLASSGRDVAVGFEMFTRDNQANLNPWTLGRWSEAEFIERADWKKQWGFDFALYKPIFDVVKARGLPMVALNVPRDWVRQVSRQGPESLTEEQKKWVPGLDLGNRNHKDVFFALIGGHPGTDAAMDKMYGGQVTWDTGMAKSAYDFMSASSNPNRVMVVVAGIGHTMYGQGINYRLAQMTDDKSLNLACIEADEPRQVAKGLADFVFACPSIERKQ